MLPRKIYSAPPKDANARHRAAITFLDLPAKFPFIGKNAPDRTKARDSAQASVHGIWPGTLEKPWGLGERESIRAFLVAGGTILAKIAAARRSFYAKPQQLDPMDCCVSCVDGGELACLPGNRSSWR
jgi:hypothetical protein